jgi:hypothetical protein
MKRRDFGNPRVSKLDKQLSVPTLWPGKSDRVGTEDFADPQVSAVN